MLSESRDEAHRERKKKKKKKRKKTAEKWAMQGAAH
jgi:hypothetical protein